MKRLQEIKDKYVELSKGYIDYEKLNNYLITHHSTAIEGSTLTHSEVVLLLENGITPQGKPFLHLLMEKDHLEALNYVLEIAGEKQKLSTETIQQISALIMKNTGALYNMAGGSFDASKGEFRKGGVHVGTRSFVDYNKVPWLVQDLVDYINSEIDNCHDFIKNSILAFDAHFQMVSIHPFADGNGRLSRLLMNYVQHYHKHPITPVLSEDKARYFEALEQTRQQQNPDVFRKFMFDESLKYFNQEISMMTQKQVLKKKPGKGLTFLY
nr:Fic family protein [Sunxiuqinia sp.]